MAAQNYMSLDDYALIILSFAGLIVFVCAMKGLYHRRLVRSWAEEVTTTISATMTATAMLVVLIFYLRPFSYSRAIFIFALALAIVYLAAGRLGVRILQSLARRRGHGVRQAIVVGAGEHGRRLMQSIVATPELGYVILGFVDDERQEPLGRFNYLGPLDALPEMVRCLPVDEVIVALPSHNKAMQVIRHCSAHDLQFRVAPDFYELSLDRVDVDYLHGIPLLTVREETMSATSRFLKRTLDLALSVVGVVLLSPLLLIVALAIKRDSPGPVLFRQTRVGRNGEHFQCYKFRSMRQDAEKMLGDLADQNEASGPLFKMRNDPRITRVGKWIRRTSIDELPQLFNVLKGEMSIVGPRPPVPSEVAQYEPWHRRRLGVSPGITGMWQVSGRSNLTFDEMVLLDLWYIENWTIWLDFRIILLTVPAVLMVKGAY